MTAWQEGCSSAALTQIALNSRLKFRLRGKTVKMKLTMVLLKNIQYAIGMRIIE